VDAHGCPAGPTTGQGQVSVDKVCAKCLYERNEYDWGCAICRTRWRDKMRELEDEPLVWSRRDPATDTVVIDLPERGE